MSGIFHMMWGAVVRAAQTLAQAIDLDGTNDYFSRASDLTGNADGKTFTFSAWVWGDSFSTSRILYVADSADGQRFTVYASSSNEVIIQANNSAGTQILNVNTGAVLPIKTFAHILCSIDLANTSNRSIYINDVLVSSPTWTTYTNDNIDFTEVKWRVSGRTSDSAQRLLGRVSNLFLDYTYRDLSNSTNRRLFITADRKPASGQAALNPILYLPMDDPTTAHVNQGTGGDFTLNGTIARSGRGPNQYNTPYSDLNGSSQYLSKTSAPTGIANSKTITFYCVLNPDNVSSNRRCFWFGSGASVYVDIKINGSGQLNISGKNTSASVILEANSSDVFVLGRNYVVVGSIDLSDTGKRYVYINGVAASMTWSTYTDDSIMLTGYATPRYYVGYDGTNFFDGRLGDVFFHTSYIDLSAAANLAKFVTGTGIDAKPVDLGSDGSTPLGVQPLIYLPMFANNAGKNYGSGGDFTVNSGPYTGARGPSEFFGNKWDFNGTSAYAYRSSALSGVSDGKTFSCSFWFYRPTGGLQDRLFEIQDSAGNEKLRIHIDTGDVFRIFASGGSTVLAASYSGFAGGSTKFVQMCIDLTSTSNRKVYMDGVDVTGSFTWTTYTNSNIALSETRQSFGAVWNGASYAEFSKSDLSEFFFTTEYIDFSQESNRLKFRDCFGNPCDIPAQIAAGTLNNPPIYMRFSPSAPAANSGTGGDFTAVNYVDGGQL